MVLSTLSLDESQRLQALEETFRSLPDRGHTTALRAAASGLGYSADGLNKLYYKWKRGGLSAVADQRRQPVAKAGGKLSADIVKRYMDLEDANQRKSAPAYRALKAELMCSGWPERAIPSESSLRLASKKASLNRKAELGLARYGFIEAARSLPQVLSTRVGLWEGSHRVLDDVWHDNFTRLCKGNRSYAIVRPLQLTILDLFTGDTPTWGCRPRLPNEDGTKHETLKEADTRFLVATDLYTVGYSPRGTKFLAEHGTAAIRDRLKAFLFDQSGGLITVEESGIVGNEAIMQGMFAGKGKGNSNFKAALESWHNLLHNEAGFAPAQTGMTRDHRPESTNAMLAYTTEITKLAVELKDDGVLDMLAIPIMDWHSQWMPFLQRTMDRIAHRTWHNLEGWSKIPGNCFTEYLVSADLAQSIGMADNEVWIGPDVYLSLPGHIRTAVKVMATADPYNFTRPGRLSPRAAFNRGRGGLIKMPDHVIAQMLTLHGDLEPEHFQERKVKAGYLRFWDMQKESGELRYESVITDPQGNTREMPSGSEWLVCVNPFNMDRAWCFNAKGAFCGTVPRAVRVSRLDEHSVTAEMGRKAHRAAVLLNGFKERHADEASDMQAMRDHNAQILGTDKPKASKPKTTKPRPAPADANEPSLSDLMAAAAAAPKS